MEVGYRVGDVPDRMSNGSPHFWADQSRDHLVKVTRLGLVGLLHNIYATINRDTKIESHHNILYNQKLMLKLILSWQCR